MERGKPIAADVAIAFLRSTFAIQDWHSPRAPPLETRSATLPYKNQH